MKKLLLFSFILGIATGLMAQDISVSPSTNITVDESENPPFEIVGYGSMVNNTSEAVTVHWSRDYAEGPAEWISLVCDKNLCHAPSVSTETVTLEPGENGTLDVHLRPMGVQGCGEFRIYILSEDMNDTLAVGAYLFQVGDNPGCEVAVSTNTPDLEFNFKLTPNPVTNGFMLQGDERIAEVQVFSLVGAPVKRFAAQPNAFYSVADLTAGIYLVQALDDSGRTIKTVRMVKK